MIADRLLGAAIAAGLVARGLMVRRPTLTLARRLAMLPADAPTEAPLAIHWNDHQIPFIEAASDADLAVGLGMVHAHLRLGQMEIMRRLAWGRASEMIGPLGIDIDRALRLIDFPRAVPAIVAGLAPETRAWGEGFVRGVNHVLARLERLPEEMRLLGIAREPWTVEDLFANTRLAAADVNWLVYGRLLRARASLPAATWRALWRRLPAGGAADPLAAPLGVLARAGSNAAAVAGWRSATGGALFAADPHLSVALPNIWLIAGMRSPGLNVVGLMPAGFPIVAIGRNANLAWGGTSLHAAASDLFDAADLPLQTRTATLRVRGVGTRRITLRESPLGPVVSDGMMFANPTPLALRWVGHTPTDELGAMLGVMRAANSDDFARALDGFAIPGQNMLHATAAGDVGHLLALRAPRRPAAPPPDLVMEPEAARAWESWATRADFPETRDPPDGVVASANDAPPHSETPAGFFYSPPDRMRRLRALLGGGGLVTPEAMAATQTDVQGPRDRCLALIARMPPHPARDILAAWDGGYDADSAGAVVFEALMAELARRLPDQARVRATGIVWTGRRMIADAILALDDAALGAILGPAMDRALRVRRRHGRWGQVHRMRLRHYLGAVPVLGWRYRFGAYPSPGGNDTLNKAGNGPVKGPHPVTYGASARFVADLADPDANLAVLLGGQDGWLGSDTVIDQVAAWRRGDYVALPLRPETARAWPHTTVLRPV